MRSLLTHHKIAKKWEARRQRLASVRKCQIRRTTCIENAAPQKICHEISSSVIDSNWDIRLINLKKKNAYVQDIPSAGLIHNKSLVVKRLTTTLIRPYAMNFPV